MIEVEAQRVHGFPAQRRPRITGRRRSILVPAVGVMVFEALSGHKPYAGRTPAQVLTSMAENDARLPGDSAAVRLLNAVLERCLSKEPSRRYASAPELRAKLIPAIRACPEIRGQGAGG